MLTRRVLGQLVSCATRVLTGLLFATISLPVPAISAKNPVPVRFLEGDITAHLHASFPGPPDREEWTVALSVRNLKLKLTKQDRDEQFYTAVSGEWSAEITKNSDEFFDQFSGSGIFPLRRGVYPAIPINSFEVSTATGYVRLSLFPFVLDGTSLDRGTGITIPSDSQPQRVDVFFKPVAKNGHVEYSIVLPSQTVDQSEVFGLWRFSDYTITGTIRPLSTFTGNAIDIASGTGVPSPSKWREMADAGVRFAVVNAWGGNTYGNSLLALPQLAGAHQAGVRTAAYCELNFNNRSNAPGAPGNQSGAWQVGQALRLLGNEAANLSFLAIAVEDVKVLTKVPKAGSKGVWVYPPDVTPADRVARIDEAIQAVRSVGLTPVIYTDLKSWQSLTDDSTAFAHSVPLWDVSQNANDSSLGSFQKYGGWITRLGRQYDIGPNFNGTIKPFGVLVDLDTLSPTLFGEE